MFSTNALHAGLAGTIGEAAAADMAAFVAVEDSVTDVKDILKNPDLTPPDEVAAQLMIMFQAVDVLETQDDMTKFMRYVNKIPSQMVQSIFFTMATRSPKLVKLSVHNAQIKEWLKDNKDIVI